MLFLALMAVARAGVDAAPSGRYLDEPQVATALADRSALLASCGEGVEDGAGPLSLSVEGSGHVSVDTVPSIPGGEGLAACLETALGRSPLPAHDEAPLAVSATLLVRQGRASLGPVVELHERVLPELFLFVPPGEPPALRAERWRILGLPATDLPAAGGAPPQGSPPPLRQPPAIIDERPVETGRDDDL